eukprot:SAG31_NODE_2054_length_6549_cov_33.997830_2_plen_76_part_00
MAGGSRAEAAAREAGLGACTAHLPRLGCSPAAACWSVQASKAAAAAAGGPRMNRSSAKARKTQSGFFLKKHLVSN